jgi:hypothetical protein
MLALLLDSAQSPPPRTDLHRRRHNCDVAENSPVAIQVSRQPLPGSEKRIRFGGLVERGPPVAHHVGVHMPVDGQMLDQGHCYFVQSVFYCCLAEEHSSNFAQFTLFPA